MTNEEQGELLNQVCLIIALSFWALLAWYEEQMEKRKGGRRR